KKLPGKPDLVFPKFRAVVFVQGCFWHRHQGCPFATVPASNSAFWSRKLEGNSARDTRNIAALRAIGWRVATVWECTTRRTSTEELAGEIPRWLVTARPFLLLQRSKKRSRFRPPMLSNRRTI